MNFVLGMLIYMNSSSGTNVPIQFFVWIYELCMGALSCMNCELSFLNKVGVSHRIL